MCLGTQLHLKNKFGEGYTLHVNFTSENEQNVLNFISELIPDATLMENFAGNCIYQVKKSDLTISNLFEDMEKNKQQVGIIDWGVTQTTYVVSFLFLMFYSFHYFLFFSLVWRMFLSGLQEGMKEKMLMHKIRNNKLIISN